MPAALPSRAQAAFILGCTLAAMGLAPSGARSLRVACASLALQLPLYASTRARHARPAARDALQHAYAASALAHVFLVRLLAPPLARWLVVTASRLFPTLAPALLRAVTLPLIAALVIVQVMVQSCVLALFDVVQACERFVNPDVATAVMMPVMRRASPFPGRLVSGAAVLFIIPAEISKYCILTHAVRSYYLGEPGERCRNVIIMAVMVSLPMANVDVVTSPHLADNVFHQHEWHKLILSFRVLAIVGRYLSCMLSCVMLGVRIAENAILKRKYETRTTRLSSFVFMWLVQVLTSLSTSKGVLDLDHQAMSSCTLLLILIGTGIFVRSEAVRLIADEQLITQKKSNEQGPVPRMTTQ